MVRKRSHTQHNAEHAPNTQEPLSYGREMLKHQFAAIVEHARMKRRTKPPLCFGGLAPALVDDDDDVDDDVDDALKWVIKW